MQYMADFDSEISSISGRALVIGAVSGAQQAAKFQFLFEKNKGSNDAAKHEIAINAGSLLPFLVHESSSDESLGVDVQPSCHDSRHSNDDLPSWDVESEWTA